MRRWRHVGQTYPLVENVTSLGYHSRGSMFEFGVGERIINEHTVWLDSLL